MKTFKGHARDSAREAEQAENQSIEGPAMKLPGLAAPHPAEVTARD